MQIVGLTLAKTPTNLREVQKYPSDDICRVKLSFTVQAWCEEIAQVCEWIKVRKNFKTSPYSLKVVKFVQEDTHIDMNVEGETRPGVRLLKSWINKSIKVVSSTNISTSPNYTTMKVEMSDGRVIVGIFLCTDRSGNVIIGEDNCVTKWLATSIFSMICFQGHATNIHRTLTRYYRTVKQNM